jgi:hypothetical protein
MVTFLDWSSQGAPKNSKLYNQHYCNALLDGGGLGYAKG